MWNKASGGFDLSPSAHYIAIYDKYDIDNIGYENLEQMLNALIVINASLIRFEDTIETELQFVNYMARQIGKGGLNYSLVNNLYPHLMHDVNKVLTTSLSGRNDYIEDAVNVLLMINPLLLHATDPSRLPEGFNTDLLYEYIERQIAAGRISRELFEERYPQFLK